MALHISIAAETIAHIGGFPVTNSLLTTWIVMIALFAFAWASTRGMGLVPTRIQMIAELIIGGLSDFFTQITGKQSRMFFPLLASIFLFVITANWIGLLPGVGTIGFWEEPAHGEQEKIFVPLLRGATADINTTLAIAIIAVVAIQYFGFKTVGFKYSSRFFDFSNPINFFIGILEIISEVSKIISFAFRLFGNIFAGEVLLAVMAFLLPFLAPVPFLTLELFVGFIQALVFSMLTAVFLKVAVSHGEHEAHKEVISHG